MKSYDFSFCSFYFSIYSIALGLVYTGVKDTIDYDDFFSILSLHDIILLTFRLKDGTSAPCVKSKMFLAFGDYSYFILCRLSVLLFFQLSFFGLYFMLYISLITPDLSGLDLLDFSQTWNASFSSLL